MRKKLNINGAKIRFSFFLIYCLCLASCNNNSMFRSNTQIAETGWDKTKNITFYVPVTDTINYFDISISVRNTDSYGYKNLYLFVKTTAPSGNFVIDTIDCELADVYGKWLGKSLSKIWDNKYLFRGNVKFVDVGNYSFDIQQGMRQDTLKGITDVGLQIESKK